MLNRCYGLTRGPVDLLLNSWRWLVDYHWLSVSMTCSIHMVWERGSRTKHLATSSTFEVMLLGYMCSKISYQNKLGRTAAAFVAMISVYMVFKFWIWDKTGGTGIAFVIPAVFRHIMLIVTNLTVKKYDYNLRSTRRKPFWASRLGHTRNEKRVWSQVPFFRLRRFACAIDYQLYASLRLSWSTHES